MPSISAIVREVRPKQWTKNLLLFAGVIFAQKLTDAHRVWDSFFAFLIFCALSSAVYVVNDLRDAESDRQHPLKRNRPIASGDLSVTAAIGLAIFLAGGALLWAFFVHWRPGMPVIPSMNWRFGGIAVLYFTLMTLYSMGLKHIVILDLMIVALGFVIRAVAGIEAIEAPGESISITPWYVTCVLFLALFIVICKRRHELVLLSHSARTHRPVLEHYSQAFLDQMVSVATSATVLSYALYVTLGVTQTPRSRQMVWTIPFVLYGVFRYLYLVYRREEGGAPEILLLQDRSLLASVLLWLAVVTIILYMP